MEQYKRDYDLTEDELLVSLIDSAKEVRPGPRPGAALSRRSPSLGAYRHSCGLWPVCETSEASLFPTGAAGACQLGQLRRRRCGVMVCHCRWLARPSRSITWAL